MHIALEGNGGDTDNCESFMHVYNAETYRVILLTFYGLTMVVEGVTRLGGHGALSSFLFVIGCA